MGAAQCSAPNCLPTCPLFASAKLQEEGGGGVLGGLCLSPPTRLLPTTFPASCLLPACLLPAMYLPLLPLTTATSLKHGACCYHKRSNIKRLMEGQRRAGRRRRKNWAMRAGSGHGGWRLGLACSCYYTLLPSSPPPPPRTPATSPPAHSWHTASAAFSRTSLPRLLASYLTCCLPLFCTELWHLSYCCGETVTCEGRQCPARENSPLCTRAAHLLSCLPHTPSWTWKGRAVTPIQDARACFTTSSSSARASLSQAGAGNFMGLNAHLLRGKHAAAA